ncbi:MAG: hypothetical protein Q8Q32_02250 [bacterium]|nr:hypothetical protein [bacterium]
MYKYKKTKFSRRKIQAHQEWIQVEKNIFFIFIAVSLIILFAAYFSHLNKLEASGVLESGAWLASIQFAWMGVLRPIYIILSIIIILIGIYACIKFWPMRAKVYWREKPTMNISKEDRKKNPRIVKQWDAIAARANTRTAENIRLAVMEADALVDFFLKDAGYEGDHFADRLGKIRSSEIRNLERVWQAHRVRNDIAHTPGYSLHDKVAQETLTAFRDFLIEMGAL